MWEQGVESRRAFKELEQRSCGDFSMTCLWCVTGLYHPTSVNEGAERNVSTCKECVSMAACFFCHSPTSAHTPRNAQIPPFPFLITPFSVSLSLFLKEFSIHLIPLLVLLYWGWAPLIFHVKGFPFYWTSNPLCLAWRSLLPARHHAYSGADGRAIRLTSPPQSAIGGISVAITLHE